MAQQHVMIYAYTAHNLGDDLFIYTLCRRYPHVKFYLYGKIKYRTTFQHLTNLHIIPSDRLIDKVLYAIRLRPKLAIYIGGSLFIEQQYWQKPSRQLKRARNKHNLFFIIGANFGPYESSAFYNTYEDFFKNCTDVCFRDKKSAKLFQHLPNVRYANDVVFTYPAEHTNAPTQTIVISVIYPAIRQRLHDTNDTYFTTLATFAMKCIDKGFNITWMAFCTEEKDDQAINDIYELIHPHYHAQMTICHYETNIALALNTIAQAQAVIATRFHAMILGLLYEKPTFAILYSDKMLTVIEDNKLAIPYEHITQLQGKNVIEKMLTTCQQAPISILEQIHDADDQFMALDRELKED